MLVMNKAMVRLIVVGTLLSISVGACKQSVLSSPDKTNHASDERLSKEQKSGVLLSNIHVLLTGDGQRLTDVDVYVRDGHIDSIGKNIQVPPEIPVIDVGRRWVTPGLIDVHSHLGSYPTPAVAALSDANEKIGFNVAGARIQDSTITNDAGFGLALAGGVTTMQLLPGSHTVFGGAAVIVKTVPMSTVQEMMFPDAPSFLKVACGENPKFNTGPMRPETRMGVVLAIREELAKAKSRLSEGETSDLSSVDPNLATLMRVLQGEIALQVHCYRAEEMANLIELSEEYGFRIAAFHHASEAYKIADLLADSEICAVMFSDWWGFKMEAYDAIPEGMAFVHAAGGCSVIHSDSTWSGQFLNQELAIALAAGHKGAGLEIRPEEAITWATSNAARVLGIDSKVGTIRPGLDADIVVWSGDPFSVYTKADQVFVDGRIVYDRNKRQHQPTSDFELGQFINLEPGQ